MSAILEFENVKKKFGDVHALNGINFSIPAQTIFGLLGPNGAGKTTLIRIITNILAADEGRVIFNGTTLQSKSIGYMPEEKGMYKKMKVGEHLIYLAKLRGLKTKDAKEKIQYWLKKLQAEDWWNKKIEDLSKGMQQKIQFISTVVHEPALLILDEPFSGLDPVNAEIIKNEIYELQKSDTTILFSTHRMEQVEEICEQIALINKGSVIVNGTVKDIKQSFKENIFYLGTDASEIPEQPELFKLIGKKKDAFLIALSGASSQNDLLLFLINHGIQIHYFEEAFPSLNEIFIKLVNSETHA